jgi:hypothetical protein
VTDEELLDEPGALATRADDEPTAEPVFSPQDFKLNLRTRLELSDEVVPEENQTNLDSPTIRKLTWEHVVPDRPASSALSAATLVPLPPPRRVNPPSPPRPAMTVQKPPPPLAAPSPDSEHADDDAVVEDDVDDVVDDLEIDEDFEDQQLVDEDDDAVVEVRVADTPEVNRLAFVPDLIDDDSPIELPPITPSGPVIAHAQSIYAPVLAETLYVPPSRQTTTIAVVAPAVKKPASRKSSRKPKRHLFRSFMTLVVLFGLLAGGAFAAKKYLLHPPTWAPEMKPLADDVAAARGLQFKVPVDVTELPVGDYATRLAESVVGGRVTSAPTWRALGLLNGELDLETIGRQALTDSPAFYDPTSKTILVSNDLKVHEHLYRFALHRALATALLDQQFDWSSRAATASPAAALGLRATIDGDALAIANALAANDGPDQLAPDVLAFVQGHSNTVSPSQYIATLAGRAGVALRPTIASMTTDRASLAALEQGMPTSDAAFDAVRSANVTPSPPGTQGMMFWYYVLASRIDDTQAWSAVIHWTNDSLATSTGSASQCVDAKVGAGDTDGAAALLAAFQAWAATATPESTTTVTPIDGNQVAIRACDPGASVTAPLPPKIPVAFGGAGVERALVQAAVSAAGVAKVDPACLITAARQRGTVLTLPADDAPVLAVNWQSAYVAANLDLATGCVAAPAAPVAPAG